MSAGTGITALRAAAKILGGGAAIGRIVDRSQPYVSEVLNHGTEVPAEWCIPLQDATAEKGQRIPRAAFRPDLYPGEPTHYGDSKSPSRDKRRAPPRQRESSRSNHQRQAVG